MDRYAVVGNPIKHSKSPEIHQMFAEQTGQQLNYEKILFDENNFVDGVRAFFESEGKGLNVTVPFKEKAFDLVELVTERAKLAGAVNTLIAQPDGSLIGDNTDGAGLVGDIRRLRWPLAQAKVLLVGAGGAARGVLQPLLAQGVAEITIVNRTSAKAKQLAEEFSPYGKLSSAEFLQLSGRSFDLIINATSAGLAGDKPPLADDLITAETCAYDMLYGAEPTAFLAWAEGLGAKRVSDGLGMLVGQAAESFYQWRHVRPDVLPVIEAIRGQLLAN